MICKLLGICNNPKVSTHSNINKPKPIVTIIKDNITPPRSTPIDIPRKKKLILKQ